MGRTRREMTMAKAFREFPLAERAKPVLERLGAIHLPEYLHAPEYIIATDVGTLSVTVYEDWLACAFKDVERARMHLGQHIGPPVPRAPYNPRLNGFCGKWNWHWFEFAPHDSYNKPTVPIVTTALTDMLAAFEQAVRKILPTTTAATAASPQEATMAKSKTKTETSTDAAKPAAETSAAAKPAREDVHAKHRAEALATVRKLAGDVDTLATAVCVGIEQGKDMKASGEYVALKSATDELKTAVNKLGLHAAPKAAKAS